MKKTLEPYQLIERSIIKKYRKELWTPFIVAVKRYELVQAGDRIAVCISGGKDSMLMAKLMQELQRHSDVLFELVFLVMDPGYNEINRQKIESNAELLHIPVTIFESNIFAVANNTDKNPCYLCARMRRGHLYSKARELGCNKIALGHHFNDVIETTVMSMFYGSQLQAMPPKLHSTSFPGMTLIRPMYCIREEDILAWKRYNELEFIQCACRFMENCTMCDNGGGGSKRQEIKTLLRRLKRENQGGIKMTPQEVKDFLNRGYRIKERIAAKERRIDEWRRRAESITAEIKPVASFSSTPSKKVEDAACAIVDLQSEIKAEIYELAAVELEIGRLIKESGLDDTDQFMMELRYLNYMRWEEIAVELHYAYRWVMRRHKKVLLFLGDNWSWPR